MTTAREALKAQELREYMARPVIYTAEKIAQIEKHIAEFEKHIANIKVTVSIYGERDALSIQANSLIPECTRVIAKYRAELVQASRDPKTRFDGIGLGTEPGETIYSIDERAAQAAVTEEGH